MHQIDTQSTSSGGGGLLDQIKRGVNLKKNEKPAEKEIIPENNNTGFNTNLIAMVLNQRREAIEDSEDDSDDSDWD